jgi:osmotically inducible lipoprotein OsmB
VARSPTSPNLDRIVKFMGVAALVFSMTACGSDPGDRMLSGAGIGAGVGVGAALLGAPLLPALLVGGAVGAATGGLTNDKQIDLSR